MSPSERGRHAVLTRWGGGRIVRLDDPHLSPEARRLILALVAAAKAGSEGGPNE
jgi:hypothetical protein